MGTTDNPLLPPSAAAFFGELDMLGAYVAAAGALFALLILALLVVSAYRYGCGLSDHGAEPMTGTTLLEILWTGMPVLVVLSFWGAGMFLHGRWPPTGACEIQVVGRQWQWNFQHPEGRREINELHIPVGQPIRLTLTSEDVIHSFFVPAFHAQRNVLPGRYTSLRFDASETGEYLLFCTEYCGAEHAGMSGKMVVMGPVEYKRWLSGGHADESLVAAGKRLYGRLGCPTCHGGQPGARGPGLTGLYGSQVELSSGAVIVADDGYIRESIASPTAKVVAGYDLIMPVYRSQVSEQGLLQLIAYIRSLGRPADEARGPAEAQR